MAFGLRRAKVLGQLSLQLVSKISNIPVCGPDPPTSRTDGLTDECNRNSTPQYHNNQLYAVKTKTSDGQTLVSMSNRMSKKMFQLITSLRGSMQDRSRLTVRAIWHSSRETQRCEHPCGPAVTDAAFHHSLSLEHELIR